MFRQRHVPLLLGVVVGVSSLGAPLTIPTAPHRTGYSALPFERGLQSPYPNGLVMPPFELWHDLACTTATACTSTLLGAPTADRAGRWSPPTTLTRPSGTDGMTLSSIACSDMNDCTAVGWAYREFAAGSGIPWVQTPVIVTEVAGAWGAPVTVSLPSAWLPAGTEQAQLTSVQCLQSNSCVGVGVYRGSDGLEHSFGTTDDLGIWSAPVQLLQPPGPFGAIAEELSCTSSTSCTALGTEIAPIEPIISRGTYTWSMNAGVWSAPSPIGTQGSFFGVSLSCLTSSNCIAVGATKVEWQPGQYEEYAVEEAGTWSTPRRIDGGAAESEATQLACSPGGTCMATVQVRLAGTDLSPFAISAGDVLVFADGMWSQPYSVSPLLRPHAGTWSALSGIACLSSGSCIVDGVGGWKGGTRAFSTTLAPT